MARAEFGLHKLSMWNMNKHGLRYAGACFLWCALASAAMAADEEQERTINIAYANILGSGIYEIGGRSAYVLNMPFEFVLYEPKEADWSLNLLLPVTVGVLDVDWGDFWGDDRDGDRLQTLGVTPGIELDVPLSDQWTLKPFLQAGYIYDPNDDYDAWLTMGGVRSLFNYQLGEYTLGFGAAVTVAEQRPVSTGDNTGIGVIDVGLDVRRRMSAQLRGQPLELSVYAIASHYYNKLDLLDVEDDDFHVQQTFELGMTLGTAQPFRVLGIDWQRVGMGYMWGDGIESITFNLGFPF